MSRLDQILYDAQLALGTIQALSGPGGVVNSSAAGYAVLLDRLLGVVVVGIKAHEALAGKPLDLSTLHTIEPVAVDQ